MWCYSTLTCLTPLAPFSYNWKRSLGCPLIQYHSQMLYFLLHKRPNLRLIHEPATTLPNDAPPQRRVDEGHTCNHGCNREMSPSYHVVPNIDIEDLDITLRSASLRQCILRGSVLINMDTDSPGFKGFVWVLSRVRWKMVPRTRIGCRVQGQRRGYEHYPRIWQEVEASASRFHRHKVVGIQRKLEDV